MIKHKEMMAKMNTGEFFDITYVSFDKKRKTGGALVSFEKAIKHQAGKIVIEPKGETAPTSHEPGESKNPNHDYHGTINIKTMDGSIRKVRTRLVTHFNHQEVSL